MKYLFVLVALFSFRFAKAIEYNELEVYGFQTTNPHELEIENDTSVSSADKTTYDSQIVRSTMEFNLGLSERWELAAYIDYTRPGPDQDFDYQGFRAHARTNFFEKNELPVDLGAYVEVELPRDYRKADMAFEFKPIIEKDFSRWTIALNPYIEFEHQTDDAEDLDADPNNTNKTWHTVYGMSSTIAYRFSETFKPHLDIFNGFTDQDAMLMPSVDITIIDHLKLTLGLGFGLNDRTERKLVNARLEYEVYF